MPSPSFFIGVSVIAYVSAFTLIWKHPDKGNWQEARLLYLLLLLALACHAMSLLPALFAASGPSLGALVSLSGWLTVLAFLAYSLLHRSPAPGLVILPVAVCAVLFGFHSGTPAADNFGNRDLALHLALSIPTYVVLSFAFAQACLIALQEHYLHNPNRTRWLPALPAMQRMENSLFVLTVTGFLLMTINLFVGMISNYRIEGAVLQFNHHILLSAIAWAGFGVLLLGRKLCGWRGTSAANWTIMAFIVLILAYFGTRFVNELLLS